MVLTFKSMSFISKTAFYHASNISKDKSFLSVSEEILVQAFISSHLGYNNELVSRLVYEALPLKNFQLSQNAAGEWGMDTLFQFYLSSLAPSEV